MPLFENWRGNAGVLLYFFSKFKPGDEKRQLQQHPLPWTIVTINGSLLSILCLRFIAILSVCIICNYFLDHCLSQLSIGVLFAAGSPPVIRFTFVNSQFKGTRKFFPIPDFTGSAPFVCATQPKAAAAAEATPHATTQYIICTALTQESDATNQRPGNATH